MMSAPASARPTAIARPIPLDPPVTKAVLPCSEKSESAFAVAIVYCLAVAPRVGRSSSYCLYYLQLLSVCSSVVCLSHLLLYIAETLPTFLFRRGNNLMSSLVIPEDIKRWIEEDEGLDEEDPQEAIEGQLMALTCCWRWLCRWSIPTMLYRDDTPRLATSSTSNTHVDLEPGKVDRCTAGFRMLVSLMS